MSSIKSPLLALRAVANSLGIEEIDLSELVVE